MDGNGRWAKERGLPRIEGHRRGVENVRTVLRTACELEIPYITLYAFSVENWRRPPDEISALMGLLELFLRKNLKDLLDNEIRLQVIGRPEALPERVQKQLKKALEATKHFTRYNLNVALNYGSRTEVVDAVAAYAKDAQTGKVNPDELDYETFNQYLYTANTPDPDLLIRTSGESRISNFLLLQCAYSEMYFTPVYWPDFGRGEMIKAIETYRNRERRFGKTGEQIRDESVSEASL